MNIGLTQALISLYPNSIWVLEGNTYDNLKWQDENIPKPTEERLNAEIAVLQNAYNKNLFQRQRETVYPRISDQLDMLWHMMDQSIIPGKNSNWYNTIADVKNQYPKPTA